MKKIFTLLLLVFCLTMQAQIQRTIAGCTLGSSMSEVKSILKKNGFKIEYVDNETLSFQMSTFDGMKTESVKFCFYNDKLYDNSSLKFEIMAKQLYVASQRVL